MRLLGMQIGDASTATPSWYAQSARRSLRRSTDPRRLAPSHQRLAPGCSVDSGDDWASPLGLVIAIGWPIYLLMTTAQSPTKQGLHDIFAHTMVVKAARAVG